MHSSIFKSDLLRWRGTRLTMGTYHGTNVNKVTLAYQLSRVVNLSSLCAVLLWPCARLSYIQKIAFYRSVCVGVGVVVSDHPRVS